MNEALIEKQNIFNRALDEQQEIFRRKIQENSNVLDELKKLDVVASAISMQSEKLDTELESLNALKAEITQMGDNQSKKMDELIAAIQNMSVEVSMPDASTKTPSFKLPKPIKYMLMAFVGLGIIVFLVVLLLIFMRVVLDGGKTILR